jgi:hypothetical protein
MPDPTPASALAAIPGRFAQPAPDTLATIPKGGVSLSYMGHAEVTLALIDVDPLWNWRPMALDVDTGTPVVTVSPKRLTMWGYLTVHGVERLCVGTCEPNKGDPEKELIGDLLRNGAMRFGIGTKLWSKAVSADPVGRSDDYDTYEAPAPVDPAARALYARVAATKGTPVAALLKDVATAAGRTLTAREFESHPLFAEAVADIIAAHTPAEVPA